MKHSTETLARIEAIFHEALSAPEGERSALIAVRCLDDAEIMAEVEALLKACAAEELVTASSAYSVDHGGRPPDEPQRVGPYVLDRLLGRGGMGAVYLAHRADGQFEHRVAIKLIDLPLATELFRERFRLERQILAGLQHPYIARLLDGGVSDDGTLYLVMEYVDGAPLDRFCSARRLGLRDRLAVFKKVCDAVQFAHQNLVVHRDLKPDNILVTDDASPHLLDFGTAKLLSESSAANRTEFTRQGYQSFTPQYASPEQILGKPVTTASDTYSLGVLLYALLCESPPYELKEFTTEEMIRVVCEQPPRRPAGAASVGRLDLDIEAILAKALRKEEGARYLTADQFASDIEAYLNGRAVRAREGTFRYRAGKFVRRNRLRLGAAAIVALTLILGIAGVLREYRIANAERRLAESRSADLRQLSSSLLSELNGAVRDLPGSTGAQALLVTRVLEHLDRMARDARGDRQTDLYLADAYTKLANIQGNPYEQNLNNAAGGLAGVDKALALLQPLASANATPETLHQLAFAQQSRAEILFGASRPAEAAMWARKAVQTFDRLAGAKDASPALICEAAAAHQTLGDILGQSGAPSAADTAAAVSAYRETVALDYRALAIDPNFLRAKRGLGIMQMKIGSVELATDPAQALKDFEIALDRVQAVAARDGSVMGVRSRMNVLRKVGDAARELGDYKRAADIFERVYLSYRETAAADPKDARALYDLALVQEDAAENFIDAADPALGARPQDIAPNRANAIQAIRGAIDALGKLVERDPQSDRWAFDLARQEVQLGSLLAASGDVREGEALTRRGIERLRKMVQNPQAAEAWLQLAASALINTQPSRLRDYPLAFSVIERGLALTHRHDPEWFLDLSIASNETGQSAQAREAASEGLSLLPPVRPGQPRARIRRLLEHELARSRTADASN